MDNPVQEVSLVQPVNQKQPVSSGISKTLIIVFIAIVFLVGIGIFVLETRKNKSTEQYNQQTTIVSPTMSKIQRTNLNDFFFFSIPKPIKDLTLSNLPDDGSLKNVVKVDDHLWLAGSGSLVEYDTKSGKIISYSDPLKANCDSNAIFVNKYIYTSCRINNDDAFGGIRYNRSRIFIGGYAVFKINPKTHIVEKIFSKDNGLLNAFNYTLVADKNTVWIQTFKGIGRIDTKTNKVFFYPDSQIDIAFGAGKIISDKEYVWAYSLDKGVGFALFDKAAQTWHKFSHTEVIGITDYSGGLQILPFGNATRLVQGGLQVGMYAGNQATDNCMIRRYDYATKHWSTSMAQQVKYDSKCEDLLKPQFPADISFTNMDQSGLIQIQLPGDNKTYKLDGRNNLFLSPVINNKRYILTTATIDTIDNINPFSQILVKLGSTTNERSAGFLVDPGDTEAIVINYPECPGEADHNICRRLEKIWLVDLSAGKVLKIYTQADNIPFRYPLGVLSELQMTKQGNNIIINDATGKEVMSINSVNYALTTAPTK